MPGAGFYPIHTDKLTFRSDGRWYADDEPVLHERLARLFSRYLRRKPSGGYEIWIDERYHADVDVEDTAFVVTGVTATPSGFEITLNDGSSEPLDCGALTIGPGNVLYCHVKGGAERARFLRSVYYELAAHIEPTDNGGFQLHCGNTRYPIAARE